MLRIDKDFMYAELLCFLKRLFICPEIAAVRIRNVDICRESLGMELVRMAADRSYHDCFSDVDLHITVRLPSCDDSGKYMDHISRLGIDEESCLGYTLDRVSHVCRAVFRNGMRYDMMFDFESDSEAAPIAYDAHSGQADCAAWPAENVNRFWFVQIQALGKLYRGDYLISSHLANMNLNETLVQQMVRRDMERGTNHHRYGYAEKLTYRKHQGACPIRSEDETFQLIADKIHCAARADEEEMRLLNPAYEERYDCFMSIWQAYEQSR